MIASLRRLSYRYPSAPGLALEDVSCDVEEGSFTLLAGPSAGGKSTLLRVFNGLVPQFHGGLLSGIAVVASHDPARTPARRMATLAGMVFQEPESQAVADVVEDEIAFGMEQHRIDPAEMGRRLDALLQALGIEHLRHRVMSTLSGGERQRAAIAAVLALEPRLLLLDEPTSQLDPSGAAAVIAAIDHLHHEHGLTVLLAEHRLERLLPRCDTVLEVDGGHVTQMTPREAAARLRAVPPVCALGRRLSLDPVPLTTSEASRAVAQMSMRLEPAPSVPSPGDELVRADELTVSYGENVALRGATLAVHEGEIVALLGANGSGKTTLFRALAGLVPPVAGRIAFRGCTATRSNQSRTAFAGLVPQDPAIALYHETVRDEVAETGRNRHVPPPRLEDWGIEALAERNPRDLSVGQQQRVAIAAMLAHEPRVWLLDEPTRGADGEAKRWLAARLHAHASQGGAAIVATHDIESAARWATRVIALDRGEVSHDLPARQAFGRGPFPTQVAQVIPGAVLPEEVSR